MKPAAAEISVCASESGGVVLEQYAYTPGTLDPIQKHSHEAYQFALSFDHHGEYTYRGEKHQVPVGRLSVIHSGEVHAPGDCIFLESPAHFAMANIHPKWFSNVVADITGEAGYAPFFAAVLPQDAFLNRLFLRLSVVSLQQSSQLEQETALWNFLACLIGRYGLKRSPNLSLPSHEAVTVACDYLRDRYEQDISLSELANVAGLSRFHFCRLFRQRMGVSASIATAIKVRTLA